MNYLNNPLSRTNSDAGKARSALFLGASMLVMTAFAAPVAAQDAAAPSTAPGAAADSQEQEVVVTGLRGSLQRNLDIKRSSAGIVDAISSEDIGKFPDANIADSLERVPGVSVSRGVSSLGGLPTTTGDATEITVRGFGPDFNQTLFDGRRVSTGTGNRGFDFSTVGADFVGEVDVLKTPDAALSSGAIGATIDIKYPKPFDHPGLRIAATAAAADSPERGKITPNGGALISDTFAGDTLGFLVDFAYSDHKVRQNHVNVQGWEGINPTTSSALQASQFASDGAANAAKPAWFIQDYGIYKEFTEDKRYDGRAVLQWKPSDSLVVTLNDDYSRERVAQDQYGYSVWFNSGSLTNITTDKNGTITNFNQPNTPTDFQAQMNAETLVNNEFGANVKWTVSSNFNVELDADRAQSWLNPDGQISSIDSDVGYGSCASGTCLNENNVGISLHGANGVPTPNAWGPNGNTAAFLNPAIIGSHVFPISSNQNKDTLDQARIQGNWTSDETKIRFGVQYVRDHRTLSDYSTLQGGQDWQAYSGYGPSSGSPTGVDLPDDFFGQSFSTKGFITGFSNNSGLPGQILEFNPYQVLNYLQGLGNPQTKTIPGYNAGAAPTYDGVYTMAFDNGGYERLTEESWSPFISLSQETKIGDMPLHINMGMRDEITKVTAIGIGQQPVSLSTTPGDLTALQTQYGPTSNVTATHTYSYLLPNFDLGLDVTERLKLRLDISRSLTRPALNLIKPTVSVGSAQRVNALTASGGNPDLDPYLSDNFDLGAEWYYARNSYFSVDGFLKRVSNFIVSGTDQRTINGVTDPSKGGALAIFSVTTNLNGPTAVVRGVEVAWQQVFGNSGFGFQANATFVGTNKPYDPNNLTVGNFAVTGLANSANAVVFYDKQGFQARVAFNWRASYLDHFGQTQTTGQYGSEPVFVNSSKQVDFSTSYDFNKHISVFFEALNLNDDTYSTHGRFKNQLLDVVDYGRKFTLGARVHF